MIDASKQYRTRSGTKVRIYATDCGGKFPVHGAAWDERDCQWELLCWQANGRFLENDWSYCDLVEVVQAEPIREAAE